MRTAIVVRRDESGRVSDVTHYDNPSEARQSFLAATGSGVVELWNSSRGRVRKRVLKQDQTHTIKSARVEPEQKPTSNPQEDSDGKQDFQRRRSTR